MCPEATFDLLNSGRSGLGFLLAPRSGFEPIFTRWHNVGYAHNLMQHVSLAPRVNWTGASASPKVFNWSPNQLRKRRINQ